MSQPKGPTKVCKKCKKPRPVDDFHWEDKRRGLRKARCKGCISLHTQSYYKANRARFQARDRESLTAKKNRLKDLIIGYLRDHPCIDCGEADIVVLDFDHRDPSLKLATIGTLLYRRVAWDTIQEEIDKCDVRCANCHRKRHAKEDNWYKQRTSSLGSPIAEAIVPKTIQVRVQTPRKAPSPRSPISRGQGLKTPVSTGANPVVGTLSSKRPRSKGGKKAG